MKKIAFLLAILAYSPSAFAADMLVKAPPPPSTSSAYGWTGFYAGGNVGGVWSSDPTFGLSTPGGALPFFTAGDAALIAANGSGRFGRSSSATYGAQAGYNYQFNQTVIGAEFDVERWRLKANSAVSAPAGGAGIQHTSTSLSADTLVTLRARLGYTVDRTLLYVTGGAAFANIKYNQSTNFTPVVPTSDVASGSNQWGWTVGAGAEYAFDSHWIVRAEYLYVAFPSKTFTTNPHSPFGLAAATVPFTHTLSGIDASIARLALSYKF